MSEYTNKNKSNLKSESTLKNNKSLNLRKIKKNSLLMYTYFCLLVFIALTYYMYTLLGYKSYENYYFFVLIGINIFYYVGKKSIICAFSYGDD